MTPSLSFVIHPIPVDELAPVRGAGGDASGRPAEPFVAEGGEPLRCCLRDARPGEPLLLFGYEPALPASPYRELGAVIVHEARCSGPEAVDRYPGAWYGRAQVLRSYDARGWIRDARVHAGDEPENVIADLLADPRAVVVHSRNVAYGCYMFAVTRDGASVPRRPAG